VSVSFLSLFFSLFLSSCTKEESIELNMPSMPSSGGTAVYALSVGGGTCMNADVQGTYAKNVATTAANKVNIEVSVNTIGTWTVNSATITGFYFSGSGVFANTGTQMITLNAHGTPSTAGTQTFTLIVGGTNCTFEVDVDSVGTGPGPGPNPSGEYFPMTSGSWWSYDEGGGDTSKTVVNGTTTVNSKTYTRFINSYSYTTDTDTSLYRKDTPTNSYYLFQDLSDLTTMGLVMSNPKVEVQFLKATMAANDTWNNDFSATFNSFPVTLRFAFKCVSTTATVTSNGNTFTNVRQVEMTVQAGSGAAWSPLAAPVNLYFAKDVGMVKVDDGTDVSSIRYWHIN
jgi:hypothetical protein